MRRGWIAGALLACSAASGAERPLRVLFFSKAASWEQKIVHRDGDRLSLIERQMDKLGRERMLLIGLALFGEHEFSGRLPVALPRMPRGFGLNAQGDRLKPPVPAGSPGGSSR